MIEYVLTWCIYRAVVDVGGMAAFTEAPGRLAGVDAPAGWLRSWEGWS